ncbi:hypothetical protein LCGC14_0415980 [marine sediment metagenome]|uniref:Uncharacterized protein n=1 Tax=marine sediment metagenome TaxID=412755 RepID=A0A0F9TAF3_9ZZZZ
MPKCEREEWFKAIMTDGGVGTTKESELPQIVGSFLMQELYDDTSGTFQDCSEYNETITGYLVLVGKEGQDLLNCDQAKKVFDWDGQSFADLDAKLIEAVNNKQIVLIHCENDTYKDKTSLKVQWIDTGDAQPGGSIKKLDSSELKKLDARFKRKAKPKAATAAKPAAKPAAKAKPTTPKKPVTPKKAAPAKAEAAPGSCSKDDVWEFVCNEELWNEGVTIDTVSEAWTQAIEEMGPDEDKFSVEDWFVIRDAICKKVFAF